MKDVIRLCNKEIVHRVYAVDNERKPIAVISLTDVLKGKCCGVGICAVGAFFIVIFDPRFGG